MNASKFVKNYQSLYNSKTLSDVTVILPRKTKKRKKADGESVPEAAFKKIFAHKVILGSGSRVLARHFEKESASGSDLELADMYTFDSSQSYVPILRYLYGFPLDVEIEGMEIMTIKGLCDVAKAFEIEDLRTYTLKKMEERLVEEVHDVCSCPEDGPPRDTNPELNSFVYDVEALLETDERDSDTDELSDVMVVAVKVCCKYFAVIRQI